jgi:flagellar hook-associated protein 3 FlgL
MVMGGYERTLSDNLSRLNDSFNQMSSQKKVSRASDDPAAAMKILKSMHSLSDIGQYKDSIAEATARVNNTESTVGMINEVVKSAQEALVAANNSAALSEDDKTTYATTLKSLQDEMLQTLNTTFNGRYVFGGSEEKAAPFKLGTEAEDGLENSGTLMFYDYNADTPGYIPFNSINTGNAGAKDLTLPVDVGLGMRIGADGKVVKGTAMEAQVSAIDMLSLDMDASGGTNIFDVLGNAAAKLSADGTADLGDELESMKDAQSNVLKVTTALGEKSKMLSFLSDKNETETSNQQERLSQLQDVNITEAVMNYETRHVVYEASLSVSAKILQTSIIDFLK